MYELILLIAALKQVKRPNMFLWNLLVAAEKEQPLSKFEIHTKNARRRMAPFVSKYSGGEFFEKDGSTVATFEPGRIMPETRAKADDLLEQQFGATIYGDGVSGDDLAEDELGKEIEELDEAITRRENWMLAKLLTTGVMPIVGKTVSRAIKFGDANIEVLAGTSAWNNPESDPISYLKKKQLEILKETGINIDSIILGNEASSAFQDHPKVKEKLKYTTADVLRIEPRSLGDGAKFIGTISELELDIYTYTDWVENPETKKDEAILPEDGVLGCKSKSITVHYGAIPQMDKDENLKVFVGKRIPKTYADPKTDARYLRIGSAPLPVPNDAKGWFFSKVLDK